MSTGPAIEVAITFVWLGMVLAISFLEAPLKFRAPNVTLQIGLGIGRLVFRALNTVEVGFALVLLALVVAGRRRGASVWRSESRWPRWPCN
ncbi:putative transmembrane protein [Mycobacterium kansasii]|uniref:Putative transmembrane protein n=1 Tax=Mycobacterium kansasii TaxID=1768 RepID=A0A1V3XUD6_MYCKA|nr:putative transmembrane protein [Mycobacterium kansasii]